MLSLRCFRIIAAQFRELSLTDFFVLLWNSAFVSIPILVYAADTENYQTGTTIDSIQGICIEKGNIAEIERKALGFAPGLWEFHCHRYDGVNNFFIAKNENGIQHISWIYFQGQRNRLLSLGTQEAEIKYSLTFSAMRGRGIYPNVIRCITKYLGEIGVRRVFMCVHEKNLSSIRGIEKAGLFLIGKVRLRKIMGVQVSRRFNTSVVQ